jgi:hypothetical protein
MNRREALRGLGAKVVGLTGVASARALAQDKSSDMWRLADHCARVCAECMVQCNSCLEHCRTCCLASPSKEHSSLAQLCGDCQEICGTAAKLTARMGPQARLTCALCAKACDQCTEACEKHATDERMKACARSCRDCAKACREFSKHHGHG